MNKLSTRLLMTCAAIAVAGGAVFTLNAWFGGALANLFPLLYGATIGLYFIPGALAQALLRRPAVGLVTSAMAGLVSSPFQPIFFGAFLIMLAVGALQELPFLISRYRTWRWPIFAISGLASGLVMSFASFRVLGGEQYDLLGKSVIVATFVLSPLVCTFVGVWLAKALERAGVGRGLRSATPAPAAATAPTSSAVTAAVSATTTTTTSAPGARTAAVPPRTFDHPPATAGDAEDRRLDAERYERELRAAEREAAAEHDAAADRGAGRPAERRDDERG